jgi:aminomethyltransferase
METAPALRKTPLTELHRAHGATLVDFAGWEMPVQYSGVLAEHRAVREKAGLFDVSHMGRMVLRGPGASGFLQGILSNDAGKLAPWQGQYTLALNEGGGVRDDLILFRLDDGFLVVFNAGNRAKILSHFRSLLPPGIALEDRCDDLAMIALQGPASAEVLGRVGDGSPELKRFHLGLFRVAGRPMWISRTGYTGEDGFELYPEAGDAQATWEALREAGKGVPISECGLGARDGLRLESAYPLYGHELDEETTPWEAGLGWVVKMDRGQFLGRGALEAARLTGPRRRLVGLLVTGPVPRQGFEVRAGGSPVGKVTSGTFSPVLGKGIAMAYVGPDADESRGFSVVIREKPVPATMVSLPFYRKG